MKILNWIVLFWLAIAISCTPKKKEVYDPYANNDSLKLFLEIAYNDHLGFEQRFTNNQKVLAIISRRPNDSLNRVYHFKVANRFWNMGAFDDYKKMTEKIIKQSIQASDSFALAKAYDYMAGCFIKQQPDSSYYYEYLSEKIYFKLKDTANIGAIILKKANTQYQASDFIGSERTVFKAIKILKHQKDQKSLQTTASCFITLGNIYNSLQNYDKAIEYFNLVHVKNLKDTLKLHLYSLALDNIGATYQNKNEHPKAIPFFIKALKNKDLRVEQPQAYANALNNLAYSLYKTDDLKSLPNLFYKVRELSLTNGYWEIYSNCSLSLAEYYASEKDTSKSVDFAKDAYRVSKEKKLFREMLLALKQLSISEPKKAIIYLNKYIFIKDSLQTIERKFPNKFARIEFETDEILNQQIYIKSERDKALQRLTVVIFVSVFCILLSIVYFLLLRQRAKNKVLALTNEKQKANEEIYRLVLNQQQKIDQGREAEKYRIAQELHDGVMGRLSSIRLNLFVLGKKPDAETIAQCLPYINQIQEVEKEIRTITYDLERNTFSDSSSFSAVVGDIVKSIERHSGIVFELNIDPKISWETIDNTIKMELYRILQEALQNTVKHAKAKKVTITIEAVPDGISVEIRDDGIGFDAQSIKRGLGLQGMEHRINKIGGALQISSQPEKGTTIRLEVPLNKLI